MFARSARRATLLALTLLSAIVGACTNADPTEPPTLTPTVGDTSLTVNSLAPAVDAPAIANPVVTFWAKKGESREAFMYYQSRPGRADSTVFVRFRVSQQALLTRPTGQAFADGDSVLITITLVDPAKLIVRFEPSGLRFDPAHPADLKFNFLETDDDLDDDGTVDGDDALLQNLLTVWRRETATAPWMRQTSLLTIATHEIETDILGFTDYVVAW
jgi:hypothetical protein